MGRLGQLLVQSGVLDASGLERGLIEHRRAGGKLGEVLVRLSLVTELQVTEALAKQLQLPVTSLEPLPTPDPEILARIPAQLAHAASVLPLELTEEGRVLVVAICGPLRGEKLEQVRSSARCWVLPRLAPESALRRAICSAYGPAPAADARAPGASDRRSKEPQPGGRVVSLTRGAATTEPSGGPQHPEVRALVELLMDKGLLSADEVRQRFPVPAAAAIPHASAGQSDKESP